MRSRALALLVVLFAPGAAADATLCAPGDAACGGAYSYEAGEGSCAEGEYLAARGAFAQARLATFTWTARVENRCMHANWNDYHASSLTASFTSHESTTRTTQLLQVRWSGDSHGCDTFVQWRRLSVLPDFAYGVGCPVGEPGLLVPALP